MFGLSLSLQPIRVGAMSVTGMLLVAVLSAFATIGGGPASNDLCGQMIMEDLDLDHDLNCDMNGIAVGKDGITIDLNGHSITGPGFAAPFIGIRMGGRADVTILGHGTVTNFRTGIFILNSHDIVVSKVDVEGNGAMGFASGDGIRISGSSNILLEKNDIEENGDDGIEVTSSTGIIIVKNDIEENRAGINFIGSTGNTVEKNDIEENGCGVRGMILGNTFSKNRFDENGADFCTVVIGPRPGF